MPQTLLIRLHGSFRQRACPLARPLEKVECAMKTSLCLALAAGLEFTAVSGAQTFTATAAAAPGSGSFATQAKVDMEDAHLLTVFLGFGVFNANSIFQFQQHTNYDRQGWSTRRLGYLSEQQFGYALARFATERGERSPAWAKHLNTNVGSYWKRSMGWIAENGGRG